ncbi:hypothetical protein CEXT_34171 [Caerostris extrusa]|uniref:Uncharacterized protein n=1 Tax=Caerostris extrusa TaxID=172846 RepID=A0AAV4PHI6_CAEEX|nr:hypothetical protein CEXT_34171 [Caerostris extrusa]
MECLRVARHLSRGLLTPQKKEFFSLTLWRGVEAMIAVCTSMMVSFIEEEECGRDHLCVEFLRGSHVLSLSHWSVWGGRGHCANDT